MTSSHTVWGWLCRRQGLPPLRWGCPHVWPHWHRQVHLHLHLHLHTHHCFHCGGQPLAPQLLQVKEEGGEEHSGGQEPEQLEWGFQEEEEELWQPPILSPLLQLCTTSPRLLPPCSPRFPFLPSLYHCHSSPKDQSLLQHLPFHVLQLPSPRSPIYSFQE